MVQKNYDYLTQTLLPQFGFPGVFDEALKADMQAGVDKISKKATETVGDKVHSYEIMLDKRKNDMYYLNIIKASITNENGETVSKQFNLSNQRGFSRKEMDNLLEGRSVYRSYTDRHDQRQNEWLWLNFSIKTDDGNPVLRKANNRNNDFRLIKELGKLQLPMMTAEQKEDLMISIMQGNRTPIFVIEGKEQVMRQVEVDAKNQNLVVFDDKGKRLSAVKELPTLSLVDAPKESASTSATARNILKNRNRQGAAPKRNRKVG